jgi:hypothetical protein
MTPSTAPARTDGRKRPAPKRSRAEEERRRARVLRRYRERDGSAREMIARPIRAGGTLVIDRDLLTHGEERLIAHLAPDEPPSNADLVCRSYLAAEPAARRCRAPGPQDALGRPCVEGTTGERSEPEPERWGTTAADGATFRLEPIRARMSIPELRWTHTAAGLTAAPIVVSLREAIATLERYEPFCAVSRAAIRRFDGDSSISSTTLRAELDRVLSSPIVLNRGLREAVLARIGRDRTSMSEIAIRCGRRKRDSKGNESGETSWLARRIGLLPEGGQDRPTPWVHSDVLGLIAWHGLGIAPREVELG